MYYAHHNSFKSLTFIFYNNNNETSSTNSRNINLATAVLK
mgnify:CR=1 FL=1